jgi:hypothetical protein
MLRWLLPSWKFDIRLTFTLHAKRILPRAARKSKVKVNINEVLHTVSFYSHTLCMGAFELLVRK